MSNPIKGVESDVTSLTTEQCVEILAHLITDAFTMPLLKDRTHEVWFAIGQEFID